MKKVILSVILILVALLLMSCAKEASKTSDTASDTIPSQTGEEETTVVNPVTEITEKEAEEICPHLFRVPEEAENVKWSKIETPASVGEPLLELVFDLDGKRFTAREQLTGDTESYSHGLYYEWTATEPFSFIDKSGATLSGKASRYIGEEESVDLCTWYDAKTGMSYSLTFTAKSLAGFDLQAIVESIAP